MARTDTKRRGRGRGPEKRTERKSRTRRAASALVGICSIVGDGDFVSGLEMLSEITLRLRQARNFQRRPVGQNGDREDALDSVVTGIRRMRSEFREV